MSEKLVKVKILKNVGTWSQGDEVEVSESQAKAMCTTRKVHNGYDLVDYRTAITMDELDKIRSIPIDMGGLTVDEAAAMGLKNTVEVPKEEVRRPFHPGFVDKKDPEEMASAKVSIEMNAAQQSKRKVS